MTMKKFGSPEPIAPDDQHTKEASKTDWSEQDREALAQENAQTDDKE